MPLRLRARALPVLLLAASPLASPLASSAAAEERQVSFRPLAEVRLRWEAFDTPLPRADRDATYDFGLLRARFGGELAWARGWRLKGVLQAAAMSTLPDDAAFGSGPTYLSTNGGDRDPAHLGLAELALSWKRDDLTVTVGRQGYADGLEALPGVPLLDGVARRKLGERLVGSFDFPNVGRRYDGARLGVDLAGAARLETFALRLLAGGFHYDDAFEPLDVELAGVAVASPLGGWLPRTQLRAFAIAYRDDRRLTRESLGADVEVVTLGGSALAGTADWDLLAWLALQRGDFGRDDHRAWATVLEAGRRFAGLPGAPSFHLGFERASGGGGGGDHQAFFNLLPTNHKFYGALDSSAFSNLADLYLEGRWVPAPGWTLALALHDLRLVDRGDAWYAGSGAFSDREFGYAARRPASGRFASRDLGRELDLAATRALGHGLEAKLEAGWLAGGDAAAEILAADEDGGWLALELTWKL
ncbi:MAG: hypothetical protein F9K16_13325 [Thermoanaerobaculia bacterium]|nr:MAG: hypothetical protein F9K16_13325 [Thermoanaerobaculia bacterium]